jgi:hypothetical protein
LLAGAAFYQRSGRPVDVTKSGADINKNGMADRPNLVPGVELGGQPRQPEQLGRRPGE